MVENTLNLPKETTWKLLGVSQDMMDTKFCNKRFPFKWRSSLAISAYEPNADEIPEDLCEGKITFLKVTATITGYQPSKEETEEGYVSFPNVPTEDLQRIIDQYFACYGALLNVAVFPNPNRKIVEKRIEIDFSEQRPGSSLSNPIEFEGATFEATDQSNNRILDRFPNSGDGQGELDLFQEMTISIPKTSKVEAKVVHFNSSGVKMEAFSGTGSIGVESSGSEQGEIHQLTLEGENIDKVVFTSAENEAVLVEFAYLGRESKQFNLNEFPHIISVEPKNRDLIQAASESGEILTSSKSNVKTNKSFTQTESSETGFKLGALLGNKEKGNVSAELNHKNTESEEENWSVNTDASRERQEKEGTTTQISQLYNLLSSYHIGTNRSVFLMLPRPHVLQPTDHRTFVDGLREIEGTQEFILIVARPEKMKGLCIEAFLETGHYPEGLIIEEQEDEFEESEEEFKVTAHANDGFTGGECKNFNTTHDVESGWVVDTRPGRGPDPGHPGMQEIANDSNGQANSSLTNYNYRRISDGTVEVSGRICGQSLWRADANFDRTYKVFTRSIQPKPNTGGSKVPLEKLLITSRGLCVCYLSREGCPILDPRPIFTFPDPKLDMAASIVDERNISISSDLLNTSFTGQDRVPAMKEFLKTIKNALATSGRIPNRRTYEKPVGFLDSDYFKEQIKKSLPQEYLDRKIGNLESLSATVIGSLGKNCTVADALEFDLNTFAQKTGMGLSETIQERRKILGLEIRSTKNEES